MPYEGTNSVKTMNYSEAAAWSTFQCGHCNVATTGYTVAQYPTKQGTIKWLLCTNCGNGSVQNNDASILPGAMYGPNLQGIPPDAVSAYTESRKCLSVGAYTACELICRKILMHIAVDKGAPEGDTFKNYLTFLETQGYITKPMKAWVELIKEHGNSSTHKLPSPDKPRAENTLMFTAELLRLVYEMEHIAKQYVPQPTKS